MGTIANCLLSTYLHSHRRVLLTVLNRGAFLFIGYNYKILQLIKMNRTNVCECSGSNGTSISHSLPHTQGISQKGRHKISRVIQWGELELYNAFFFICMFPKRLTMVCRRNPPPSVWAVVTGLSV